MGKAETAMHVISATGSRGFTLLELLVVFAIMVLIAAAWPLASARDLAVIAGMLCLNRVGHGEPHRAPDTHTPRDSHVAIDAEGKRLDHTLAAISGEKLERVEVGD